MGPKKNILGVILALHTASSTHACTYISQQSSLSLLVALLSSPLFVDAAPTATSSSSSSTESDRRRKRREAREHEEKKKFWKERYGYEYVGDAADGAGEQPDQNNDDKNTSFGSSAAMGTLFVTRKPRDVIEGVRIAFSNTLRGSFYGLAALFASPIGGLKYGTGGLVAGLISGVVLGVVMPLTGVVIGAYQLVRGVVETPVAFMHGFVNCEIFDEVNRTWQEYRLDEDIIDIQEAMKKEDENKKKDGNNQSTSGSGGASRRKVKSTEYYDLLGIQTDASPSKIRSAYRKMARQVHPDKNPDDPDAEQKFRELSAAYQTLSDPAKRKKYDSSGIGVDPEQPEGAGGNVMLDPIVFFAILFGSEQVEPYIGELGMATTFDALMKLGSAPTPSFDSWEDVKTAFGWSEAALKRRKRETEIAIHLRKRVSDYVDGFLALDAFKDSCWEEAVSIAKGGSYGASFLLAIGPALVAEADSFLGYRSSVLGSWRGPVSNVKRNFLFLHRKWVVAKTVMRTASESLKAVYNSAQVVPDDEEARRRRRLEKDRSSSRRRPERVVFKDTELLKDNLSSTIPTVLDMAWAINFVDISNTLYGACSKLFHDADVSSLEERLRRAEAVHILGSQFWIVALEVTGGNTTLAGDVDDIKAQANAAFMESLKRGRENNDKDQRSSTSDEM